MKFQAYFQSENDAYATSTKLQKLGVSDVLIDRIPEGQDYTLFVPYNNYQPLSGSMKPVIPNKLPDLEIKEDNIVLTHMMEFEVPDEEVEDAFLILQQDNAYVDQEYFEKHTELE